MNVKPQLCYVKVFWFFFYKFNSLFFAPSNHESGYNEKWNVVEESPEKDKHTDYQEMDEATQEPQEPQVTEAPTVHAKSMSATMVLGRNSMQPIISNCRPQS